MNRLLVLLLLTACASGPLRAQGLETAEDGAGRRATAQGGRVSHAAPSGSALGGAERSDAGRGWLSGSHAGMAATKAAEEEARREKAADVEDRARSALAEHAARLMGAQNVRWAGLDRVNPVVSPARPAGGAADAPPARQSGGGKTTESAEPAAARDGGSAPIESSAPARSPLSKQGTGAALRPQGTGADSASLAGSPYEASIRRAAAEHDVEVELVRAVVKVESNFRADARSAKGAMGLMQLMPATARRFGAADPWDPHTNVRAGTAYLRALLSRFNGDMALALAGYNAGEGAVERYGRRIPPFRETQQYVEKVLAHYNAGIGGAPDRGGAAGMAFAASGDQPASPPMSAATLSASPARGGGEQPALQTLARWIGTALSASASQDSSRAASAQAVPAVRARQGPAMPSAMAVADRSADGRTAQPVVSGRFERGASGGMY